MFIACRVLEFSISFSRLIYWFSPDAISRPTKTIHSLNRRRSTAQQIALFWVVESYPGHTDGAEDTRNQYTILFRNYLENSLYVRSFNVVFFPCGASTLFWVRTSLYGDSRSLIGHTTFGRTPLDERSARCRYLYLITHCKLKRQTSIYPVGFEPTIPASEWPQIHALDRAATGISHVCVTNMKSYRIESHRKMIMNGNWKSD